MPKIILFNGPPSSGKDTMATMIQGMLKEKSRVVKFAAPLKTVVLHLFCGGNSKLFHDLDTNAEEKNKGRDDLFFTKVDGTVVSCRQAQIDVSESYLKPLYGQNIFGRILASTIDADPETEVFLVSDSGFRPEAEELVRQFGEQNILLFRLHREGFDYSGDSRNYIDLDDIDVKTIDINNITGDVNAALTKVHAEIQHFLHNEK